MRRATLLLAIFVGWSLVGCAAALTHRLDGDNYSSDVYPFIAESAPRLEPDSALPEQDGLLHRVILIGDAGVPQESEPVLASLGTWGDAHPDATSVLFLGDNVYPNGVEEDAVEEGHAILQAQIDATRARKIFVPGNHDWGFPHPATDRLMRQQSYLQKAGIEFLPSDGCPGPVVRTLAEPVPGRTRGIVAILIDIDPWFADTSWRPSCPDAETPDDLANALAPLLAEHADKWLIVGAHHPLRTGGPHGGFTRGFLADQIMGLIWMLYGSMQDAYEEGYRAIMEPIETVLAANPPALFAAGHDHNLQVLEGGDHARYQIVSGAGATDRVRGGYVTNIEGTLFAHGHAGFVVIDILETEDGERGRLHVVETGQTAPVFSMDLGAP